MSYQHKVLLRIPRIIHLHMSHNEGWKDTMPTRWAIRADFGRGAGCRWGRTLFLAHNCHARRDSTEGRFYSFLRRWSVGWGKWKPNNARISWQVGFTQNSNLIPYVDD